MADAERNPNEMTSREAMGLPERFVERLEPTVGVAWRQLFALDVGELVHLLGLPELPPARRIAAGSTLALLGDPRLVTLQPEMVALAGGDVRLGLAPEHVDVVLARWSGVGVRREWIAKECPAYHTRIAPFAIARRPVTNQEYRDFLLDTRAPWLPTSWRFGTYPPARANHPVWTVPAEAADAYAAWLARRTGRAFRLPTEAEWEYAACGGQDREFPWGDEFLPDRANTVEHGPLATTPVGCYPAGNAPGGIEDMAGNVEEYTASAYAPYPGGTPVGDDLAPGHRVARGGSFTRHGDLCRCRRRHGPFPRPIYAMGFRLAETLPAGATPR